ncbi:MAG: CoA pyrophosphatase [Flavobacteriaceae bacterium]
MELTVFKSLIAKLKENDLPADNAHSLLAPPLRMKQLQKLDSTKIKSKNAAVLLHLSPSFLGEMNFVLIQRNVYEGAHSGQISFPGGKPEIQDDSLWDTALREAHEEVGLPPSRVEFVRALSKLYVPPSNFLISPFVGLSYTPCDFKPDPTEVNAIIKISLKDLIEKQAVMTKQLASSLNEIEVPTYVFDDHQVWGATAMILSEFKILLTTGLCK